MVLRKGAFVLRYIHDGCLEERACCDRRARLARELVGCSVALHMHLDAYRGSLEKAVCYLAGDLARLLVLLIENRIDEELRALPSYIFLSSDHL